MDAPEDANQDADDAMEISSTISENSSPSLQSEYVPVLRIQVLEQEEGQDIQPNALGLEEQDNGSGDSSPVDYDEDSNFSEVLGVRALSATECEEVEVVDTVESNSKKRPLSDDENEDDGKLCPICLDNWTNTGEHRICSLKCGHLFGYKCVNRWLQSQMRKSCPTCKKKVGRGDLRYIYAKKLIAVDTTELDNLQKQLDMAIEEKNRVLLDLSKYICKEHLLNQEIAKLKKQVYDLTHKSNNSLPQSTTLTQNVNVRLYMDKSLEICKLGGCRVLDTSCKRDLLMVSMKSPNTLFQGFGLRKVNMSYYKPLSFIPLHSLQIRDVAFHPEEMWVLSAAMDKAFKVVDMTSNTVIHTALHQMPLWSCCWDADNHNLLYVGTQSGSVIKYDLRNINEPIANLSVPGDMSPVVSIASIPRSPSEDNMINGGIISCKLNSLWYFEDTPAYARHPLPLEGPFVSMKYHKDTKQLLVSSRPNSRSQYARHTLCTLERNVDDELNCNTVHCFQGGGMQKLLSKSCFISNTSQYIAAHHESNKSVYLWSINTGQKVATIPAHDAVLDLSGIENNNGSFLISLTERKLEFFKFI